MPPLPCQGDVWLVNFHEGWERPAVVVSRDGLSQGRLVLVVPCTSSRVAERARFPNHVLLALAWTVDLFDAADAGTHER